MRVIMFNPEHMPMMEVCTLIVAHHKIVTLGEEAPPEVMEEWPAARERMEQMIHMAGGLDGVHEIMFTWLNSVAVPPVKDLEEVEDFVVRWFDAYEAARLIHMPAAGRS